MVSTAGPEQTAAQTASLSESLSQSVADELAFKRPRGSPASRSFPVKTGCDSMEGFDCKVTDGEMWALKVRKMFGNITVLN